MNPSLNMLPWPLCRGKLLIERVVPGGGAHFFAAAGRHEVLEGNIGRTTAYKLLKSGKIKVLRIGRIYRISKESVDEYVRNESR